jgi:hypothetical protein
MIKGIGAAICAGVTPAFVPGLIHSDASVPFTDYREMWGPLNFEKAPVYAYWYLNRFGDQIMEGSKIADYTPPAVEVKEFGYPVKSS